MITGYTKQFVERQRYFPISSILDQIGRFPIDIGTPSSEKKFMQRMMHMCKIYPQYRYFAQVFYKDGITPKWGDEDTFEFLSIVNVNTGAEILRLTKEEYSKLPRISNSHNATSSPLALISMAEKGVSLLTGLTETTFWVIRNTQTMPKRLWIDPTKEPAKVSDILKMEALTKWLPDGASFDLERFPPSDKIVLGDLERGGPTFGGPTWECFEDESTSKWRQLLRHQKPKCRWVRYANRYAGTDHDRRSRAIPLHVIPEDRSILMIPMKKKNDKHIRDCRDEFEMFVEIVYCSREDGKVGDTLHDLMQHIDNL